MTSEARQGLAWLGGAGLGSACLGTGGRSSLRFDSAAPAHGRASAWLGVASRGNAGRRKAGLGRETGDWQRPGFDAPAPAHGMAARGAAVLGEAGLGAERRGGAWSGPVRLGAGDWQPSGFEALTPTHGGARPGWARHGWARHGGAMQGSARFGEAGEQRATSRDPGCDSPALTQQGVARPGSARHGKARHGGAGGKEMGGRQASGFEPSTPTRGGAWQCKVRRGAARLGLARLGLARLGKGLGDWQRSGFDSSAPTQLGVAWNGTAGPGKAGQGHFSSFHKGMIMFDVKGDRPQWQVIYERLQAMEIGEVVKYVELNALLPGAPEASVRSAFTRAVRAMEDEHKRTFANVRLVGYKMVDAAEHEGLARRHQKRGHRQITKAVRKARSADRSRLTREERLRLDAVEVNLRAQMEMTKRLEARVKTETQERKAADATLSERVDRLTEQLARLVGADAA